MREHNLKKVNVLGVNVCDLRPEKAVALSLEAMRSHELNTVFFLSAVSSLFCQETSWAMELVNSFSLVFPGDQHMEMAVSHQAVSGDNGLGKFTDEYLARFFTRLHREYREIFVVTASQERIETLYNYFKEFYPNITFHGMVFEKEIEGAADKVVNEINADIPDTLMLILSAEDQLEFLRDCETMLNTRLCICIESLQTLIVRETRYVPSWIHALHLDALYHWIKKEEKLRTRIAGSIFKKRVSEDTSADDEHDEQNQT